MKQPSQSNSKKHPTTALACHLTALAGFFMLSVSNIQATAIQVTVYPSSGSAINSSSNSTLSSGVAYVGTFFDGLSPMSKSAIASLWDATRAGYEALYSKFVSVGSALVSGGTFSINTSAEVDSVGGKSLVGKNVYVLVVDNPLSPNGFLLLAADGDGGTTFANPRETFGDNFTDLEISGKLKTSQFENLETGVTESIEAPATTSVVAGSYNSNTDRWALVSIPGSSSTLTLNGLPTVTHYWGSSYTDSGVTPSSGVTTVIRNASSQVIADFAAMHQVRTGCHGATDLSPVCMGAALHFDTWVPNFGIQELMPHSEETDAVFPHAYTFKQGLMHCGETPGHGVDIDEKLAAKYPYKRAYLPVNRLAVDGTLCNW